MPGVMNFCALRQETLAAALAPARQGRPTGFCAHPRAKTVLILPGALRAL